MRGRIVVLVAATSSAIILAFVLPLALLLRSVAEDRAVSAATQEAQSLAVLTAAVTDVQEIRRLVDVVDERSPRTTSVLLPDGTLVGERVDDAANLQRARSGEAFTLRTAEQAVVYAPAVTPSGTAVVRSAVTGPDLHRGVARATSTVAVLAVLLLAAAVLAADRLAVWLSRPVRDLARAADAMRGGDLEARVPERGPQEVMASAAALNRLAARIGELLVAERDAVADLAHRLRTPVTALRLDAEAVGGASADRAELAERLRGHVEALEKSVDAIVRDARRPVRSAVAGRCDAVAVARDRVAFWSSLAEEQGREVVEDLPAGPVAVGLGAEDLTDVLDVLLDNVFVHTADGVPLGVRLRDDGGQVEVTVFDGGPGLSGADLVTRGTSGAGSTGLGLDIARRAAAASGGALVLGTSPLGGAAVTLRLGLPRS